MIQRNESCSCGAGQWLAMMSTRKTAIWLATRYLPGLIPSHSSRELIKDENSQQFGYRMPAKWKDWDWCSAVLASSERRCYAVAACLRRWPLLVVSLLFRRRRSPMATEAQHRIHGRNRSARRTHSRIVYHLPVRRCNL